jgi:hypothetical protein
MILEKKNILLISPEPWKHIFVSKHHYAIELAKRGNTVFFLNPPSEIFEIVSTRYERLFSLHYPGFIPGLRFFPSFLQKYFMCRVLKKLEKLCEGKFDIVWSFDNSLFFNFNAFSKEILKISHIVDFNQDFVFRGAASTADFCFSPNQFIIEKFLKYNNRTYFINHGVAIQDNIASVDLVLPGRNEAKTLYGGNIDIDYFDWDTFERVVDENLKVDFILAGPWKMKYKKRQFLLKPNVYYLGVLEKDVLLHYYRLADILLLCYKAGDYKEQLANPHKMMEYLASGKMICTTFTEEYKFLSDKELISMSKGNNNFPDLYKDVFDDLEYWNADEKKALRKAFALKNTYGKQIKRIEKLIVSF